MKKLILVFLFLQALLFPQKEKGSIEGSVKTSGGTPLELVNISIQETSLGTTTDNNGRFGIENLPASLYTLVFSRVGYETKEIMVRINPGAAVNLGEIILNEQSRELDEVLIKEKSLKGFTEIESGAAKLPVANLENPQSFSATTSEMMKEQNIVDYNSALKTIPGGAVSSENSLGLSGIFIRGFQTNSFIRNGMYSFSWNGGDPQNIERIELIRGPSGPVFGTWGVAYGGLLNVVTKEPFDMRYFEANLSGGSFNRQRFAGDINSPINDEKTYLFRINAAAHSEGSFQDFGYVKKYLLAPSLLYRPGGKLEILLEAELNSLDYSANSLFSISPLFNIKDISLIRKDYFKSYSSNNLIHQPADQNNYYAKLNYEISHGWNLNAGLALANFHVNSSSVLLTFINDSLLTRGLIDYDSKINTFNFQPNLTGDFFLFNLRNRLLLGFDYQWVDVAGANSFVFTADTVNYRKSGMTILNLERLRSNYNFRLSTKESRNSYAVYISDILTLVRRLSIMLSLRYDYNDYNGTINLVSGTQIAKPYEKGIFSPQAGFSYYLIEDRLSLFGNYMQGYNYVTPDQLGNTFRPEVAEQGEAGIKMDITGRFYTALSFYYISVKDKVRPLTPIRSIQNGIQLSRGIDLDLRLNPFNGMKITGGYTFNRSGFAEDTLSYGGKKPAGTPEHTLNLWTSYIFNRYIKGIGIGLGVIYSSSYFFNDINSLSIPSYTVLNGIIFYEAPEFGISFSADNLTDERYWDYNGLPQNPARYLVTLNLKFY